MSGGRERDEIFIGRTLIVKDDNPYTGEEMFSEGTEISLSICKAYKEIPGLPEENTIRRLLF